MKKTTAVTNEQLPSRNDPVSTIQSLLSKISPGIDISKVSITESSFKGKYNVDGVDTNIQKLIRKHCIQIGGFSSLTEVTPELLEEVLEKLTNPTHTSEASNTQGITKNNTHELSTEATRQPEDSLSRLTPKKLHEIYQKNKVFLNGLKFENRVQLWKNLGRDTLEYASISYSEKEPQIKDDQVRVTVYQTNYPGVGGSMELLLNIKTLELTHPT